MYVTQDGIHAYHLNSLRHTYLPLQNSTDIRLYTSNNLRSRPQVVFVRNGGQSTLRRCIGASAKVVSNRDSVPLAGGVQRLSHTGENVVLNEKLSPYASINAYLT